MLIKTLLLKGRANHNREHRQNVDDSAEQLSQTTRLMLAKARLQSELRKVNQEKDEAVEAVAELQKQMEKMQTEMKEMKVEISHLKTAQPAATFQESKPVKQISALKENELGRKAFRQRDFSTAHRHYYQAIELDPTNITFLRKKAAVYFEEGSYDQCIQLCEKAVEIGRENHSDFKQIAKAFTRIANTFVKQGRLKDALLYFDKSVSEFRDPQVVHTRQEIEKKLNEEERKAYINPELALEEKNKGDFAYQKDDFPTALKHYTEAIKRNPDGANLYSNRAACYQKLMEFRFALDDSEKCIKLDPKFVEGHIRKGLALMAMQEPERALEAYEEALRLDPNSAEAVDGMHLAMTAGGKGPSKAKERIDNDPEIQSVLADPAMRLIFEQMTQDPEVIGEHAKDPAIAAKIAKLLGKYFSTE